MIIPQSLSPMIAGRMAFLRQHVAQLPLAGAALLDTLEQPQDATTALVNLHRLQRYYMTAKTGLLDVPEVVEAIEAENFPLWDRFSAMPATPEQKSILAKLLYEGDVLRRSPVLLTLCDYARDVGEMVLERCVTEGDIVNVMITDPLFQRRLLKNCDINRAGLLAEAILEPYQDYDRSIAMRTEQVQQPFPDMPIDADIQQSYNSTVTIARKKTRDRFYTLSVLPTPKDAELDQIPYDDYIDLFFRMIAVDWLRVNDAHQVLIAQLNAGSHLRFTNNDGTDVSMDVTGFTFCNSLVAKNVPGSEIFSAPRRDSVEGIVVGKGRYLYQGQLMEDITLRFEKGRIVEYNARIGNETLESLIESDEGTHYIGEIGIGTNPVLRQHLVNGLLVEKIGGSFHLAIGNAYRFTDYLGTPVNVDNGNVSTSGVHEDLTVMLYGKEGRIYLDGVAIMENGRFIDPRLAYLNGV